MLHAASRARFLGHLGPQVLAAFLVLDVTFVCATQGPCSKLWLCLLVQSPSSARRTTKATSRSIVADRDSVYAPPAWVLCPSGPTPAWLSVTTKQLLLSLRATHAVILCGAVSPMERTFPGPQKLSLAVMATPFMLPPAPVLPLGTCGP